MVINDKEYFVEDELEKLKPSGLPLDKQSWNIEDLTEYIETMENEIRNIKSLINQKNKLQSAADALFSGDEN